MQSKYIIAYIIVGILIVAGGVAGIIIARMGSSQESTDLETSCCAECRNAFSKSPVGVGPEIARCGAFSTGQPMREECKRYFRTNPMTAYECA